MSAANCKHEIKFKDMCATCGEDLRKNNTNTAASITPPTARVSMIHHVPELVVSKDLADQLGAKEYEQILKARKLILLVDLDQTLIHTTNKLSKKYESRNDLFRFRCQDGLYFTKLRPHTREFLENMHRLFDMHIISFGQRYYAHKIAKFLDPDGKFFGQRIMSRDELTSGRHKTNNIPALFPCPDQRKLIVIIDDRDDVWQYSESLVRIRPYKFFSEVDDINAPPTAPRGSVKKLEAEEVAKGEEPDEGSKAEVEKREPTPPPPPTSSPTIPEDSDNVLEDVERVLTEVHRAFFEHYDKTKEVTDVSAIVSYMRKQVLKNEVICLSGIVPIGYPKKRSLVYRLCEQFGATVADDVDEKTTVLIAARPSTEKVRIAMKKNIPVCTPEWLYTCSAKWLNVPKKDFGHHGLDIKHFRELREAAGNQSPKLSDLEPLSKEEMKSMTDEIDAELGGETSESENEAEDDEKGSDTEGEGEIEGQPIEEIKNQVEEPTSEGDLEANKLLLAKLEAGEGDTDEEDVDEKLRNGEIDSRKRRRQSESAGYERDYDDDEQYEPAMKKYSADYGDNDDEHGGGEGDSDDDSEDEMAAAIERQL